MQTPSFFSMSLKIGKVWVIYLCCIILSAGCKKPVRKDETCATLEIILNQVILSSEIYQSNDYRLPDHKEMLFIYRYSEHICPSCVIEDLIALRDFQDKIGKDRIIILPAFSEDRSSEARLHTELADFNYQNILPDSLIVPKHETKGDKAYFAVITGDGKLEMVFFPVKGRSDITQAYLKEVEKRLQR